ncbi:MAG TPA: branched-chain amino acid ABC transporter permease [Symbiobacteriaceae bacterium]|nr:branched-chain amino acid ABC transporter permease [Symbiobacteriaceae bacterium]
MNKWQKTLLPAAIIVLVYVAIELMRGADIMGVYWAKVLDYSLVITISATGLSLIYGFTGQFSLGHAAFYGIGAYAAGYVTKTFGGEWYFYVLALAAGAAAAGLVGFLIGLPILRLRSDYLGIATLGFGIIVKVLLDNTDKLAPALGGSRGMLGIPQVTTFAWIFWLCVATVLLARNLILSSHGRALTAVREDEIAADLMGIDTTRFKTLAFVMGCTFAGLAGGLYAHLYPFLHPTSFDFLKSLDVLLVVVLGGLGSLTGTVATAIGWVFLQEWLRAVLPQEYLEFRGVIYALVLIIIMIVRPQGLLGGKEFSLDRFFGRKRGAGAEKGGNQRASA